MKDHALLTLPSEFKSQLPYEGGAFYTNPTIELARPHYRGTWAPILQASCLWLTRGGGLENVAKEKTVAATDAANIGLGPANATAQADPQDINKSRFHLLLGVCLESLCTPRSGELTKPELTSCIGALHALLEVESTRRMLTQEDSILVELCNILHRQLLSQEHSASAIISVVALAATAAAEKLAADKKAKLNQIYPANQSITEIPVEVLQLGEGGEQGILKPGKSPAFAILEVCLVVLVRYYPDISPRASQSSSVISMQARSRARRGGARLNEEQLRLVATTVRTLASLISLCSPSGSLTLAPTVFYLVISVLQYGATKSADDPEILAESAPVKAALEALQRIVSVRYPSAPEVEEKYNHVVKSGLVKILDLVKTSPDSTMVDEISLLQAIKVYLMFGDMETVTAANVKYPALNAFLTIFQNCNLETKRQSIKILQQIYSFENMKISVPYIQCTAPSIIRILLNSEVRRLDSPLQLALHCDALETIEILLFKAQKDKKVAVLDIYIPVLVNLLLDPAIDVNPNTSMRRQHEIALSKLTRVGGQFPAEFKAMLAENLDLKQRIEQAVVLNQARQQAELKASQQRQVPVAKPSIQLKTDFSNFK